MKVCDYFIKAILTQNLAFNIMAYNHLHRTSIYCPVCILSDLIDFMLAYATTKSVFTLEYTSDGPVKSLLFSTNEEILSFDLSWKKGWVIWTNGSGHVKAKLPDQVESEYVPTFKPGMKQIRCVCQRRFSFITDL